MDDDGQVEFFGQINLVFEQQFLLCGCPIIFPMVVQTDLADCAYGSVLGNFLLEFSHRLAYAPWADTGCQQERGVPVDQFAANRKVSDFGADIESMHPLAFHAGEKPGNIGSLLLQGKQVKMAVSVHAMHDEEKREDAQDVAVGRESPYDGRWAQVVEW